MNGLSYKAKQQILRQETQARFPYLIEITQYLDDDTTNVYRYANCDEDIEYNDKVYKAGYFSLQPPEKKSDGLGNAKLTISAIDQEWIARIRSTSKRAKIKFIAVIQYLNDNKMDIEPVEELEMTLTQAQWDSNVIQWTMIFDDLNEISMPLDIINNTICPALA